MNEQPTTKFSVRPTPDALDARASARSARIGLAFCVALGLVVADVHAQPRKLAIGFAEESPLLRVPMVHLETSAPIANLFQRAEEGVKRADWKFAIDSLQRIIDDPNAGLVELEARSSSAPSLFQSARQEASRRLAQLPAEGRQAYRVLYDGKAKGMYERAKRTHDADALRTIVARYALTSYGDDAADLLAGWALDENRPAEALTILREFTGLSTDTDVPEELTVSKLVVANQLLGRAEDAAALLRAFRDERSRKSPDHHGGRIPKWVSVLEDASLVEARWGDPVAEPLAHWPSLGGTPDRKSTMPAVAPTQLTYTPWQFDLPGTSGSAAQASALFDSDDPPALPINYPVIADGRIFLRTIDGVTALNVADLSLEWIAGINGTLAHSLAAYDNARRAGRARTRLPDQTESLLTYAQDLVLAIERDEESVSNDRSQSRQFFQGVNLWSLDAAVPTRLTAFDASTGTRLWWIGGSQTGSTGERAVCRSSPLEIRGKLWAPFLSSKDLIVGVINPRDGTLEHELLLGGIDDAALDADQPLLTAFADGLLLVPSARGVIFCVDTNEMRVRWAHRYTTAPDLAYDGSPSPPIITAGTVIYAPPDHANLIALDVGTGERRWTGHVERGAYLIAANGEHVWLGGNRISCLTVRDGRTIWDIRLPSQPSGRVARSGENLLVPTASGLLRLSAMTGATLAHTPQDDASPPLGNLVCMVGGMYSLDQFGLRRYPDIERTYPAALARYESDPDDPSNRVHLAWLEILKGEPQRADELLRTFATDGAASSDPIRRARVEALIAMSTHELVDADRRIELLREAIDVAATSTDRTRVALILGEQLAAQDRVRDAYEVLLQIGLTPDAEQTSDATGDVRAPVRTEVARRLRAVAAKASTEDRAALENQARAMVTAAEERLADVEGSNAARGELRTIADLSLPGEAPQLALIRLADTAFEDQRVELAEQLWREGARVTGSTALAAACLMRLYDVYADPFWSVSARPLSALLDQLDKHHATALVPGSGMHGKPDPDASPMTIGDWVAERRGGTPTDADAGCADAAPTDQVLWKIEGKLPGERVANLVSFADERHPALDDRVVLASPMGNLLCVRAADGEELWQASLRVNDALHDEEEAVAARSSAPWIKGVIEGNVAIFDSPFGLTAIGMASGRRLWAVPHVGGPIDSEEDESESRLARRIAADPRMRGRRLGIPNAEKPDYPYASMAADHGTVATLSHTEGVRVRRVSDGVLLWRRDARRDQIADVQWCGDLLILSDPDFEHVQVRDRLDGRLVKRLTFEQPNPGVELVAPVVIDRTICGLPPDSAGSTVAAYDVASDQLGPIWQLAVDKPVSALFALERRTLGVGLVGGDVLLVNPEDGSLLQTVRVPGATAVKSGFLVEDFLIARHQEVRQGRMYPALCGIDLRTSQLAWQKSDLAPDAYSIEPFQRFGNTLWTMVEEGDGSQPHQLRGLSLAAVDLRTGEPFGATVDVVPANIRQDFRGDVAIRPGAVVVATTKLVKAFATVPAVAQGKEGE